MQEVIEFTRIQSLVTLLEAQIEAYIKKEFGFIPNVKELSSETLVKVLNEIIATPPAQKSLAPKGFFMGTVDTVWSWGPTSAKYHRLPHLLYFAEKAQEIKELINKLLSYSQLNPISFGDKTKEESVATAASLTASLEELTKSAKSLSETFYNTVVTVTVNNKSREIAGMKGGKGTSELAVALSQLIHDKYEAHAQELKNQIVLKIQQLIQNKTTDKDKTFNVMASTTYAAIQSKLPKFENNALHAAILANDITKVERGLRHFDANEVNNQGCSPLYLAIFDQNVSYKLRDDFNIAVVQLLLENKADPNESLGDRCRCSFLHAAIFQHTTSTKFPYEIRGQKKMNMDLIKLLVSHGARLDAIPTDEPKYDPTKVQANIPGIIADKNNQTPVAQFLRSVRPVENVNQSQQPKSAEVDEKYLPPIIEMK